MPTGQYARTVGELLEAAVEAEQRAHAAFAAGAEWMGGYLPDHAGAGKAMYTKRKKASIERARMFIAGDGPNENWVKFFDEHKKKDDLADTVMQALSFIEKRPVEAESQKEKKVSPRKPTENQKNTKYSKANLAWLVKSGAKQDARFKKDLARYYSSIDELKIEFSLNS
jgi:hypothetical protein